MSFLPSDVFRLAVGFFFFDYHVYLFVSTRQFGNVGFSAALGVGILIDYAGVIGLAEVAQRFGDSCLLYLKGFDLSLVLELQILAYHKQIEPDLMSTLLYPTLDLLLGKLDPVSRLLILANKYGSWLKSV